MSCKVYGPGLQGGVQGKEISVSVDTSSAGGGRLTYHVTGPARTELTNRVREGTGVYEAAFVPHHSGEYSLEVRFNDEHVPGSPFSIPVREDISYEPPKGDASKVVTSGDGVRSCQVEKAAYFSVDTSQAGLGRLSMEMTGPSQPVISYAEPGSPGTFQYVVRNYGDYQLTIRWGGQDVPGSPFHISATDENGVVPAMVGDPSKVEASGQGLQGATVNTKNSFFVNPRDAGAGHVLVTVEGPDHTAVQLDRQDDQLIEVTYKPKSPGEYSINVTYSGIHIPGSPFIVTAKWRHADVSEESAFIFVHRHTSQGVKLQNLPWCADVKQHLC